MSISPFGSLADYETLGLTDEVAAVRELAAPLQGLRVAEVNSTLTGGGVAEILVSFTGLLTELGLRPERVVMEAPEQFFVDTKKIHNALQGAPVGPTEAEWQTYETVTAEAARAVVLDHDLVVIHDPQPLGFITHLPKTVPWVAARADLGAPQTLDRTLRHGHLQLAGLCPRAADTRALHHAGD